MLEKPGLEDEKIIACLRDSYGLTITEIEFLPKGHDSYAGVYRVVADDGTPYFLKVKQDTVFEPTVTLPRFLKDYGIDQVMPPLPTTTQELWGKVDQFTLLLYPFIDGKSGMQVGLSDSQWIEFGAALKKIHTIQLSAELSAQIPKEVFVPHSKWSGYARQLHAEVLKRQYDNPIEKELAAFWREKHDEIGTLIERADALGRQLQTRSSEFVLCHSDIHTNNLLLTADGKLFIVDWDQPILAPKERDLMFVVGGLAVDFEDGGRHEDLFFQGYGKTEIDLPTLAYYRYEWVVQDIGAFGEQIFLRDDMSGDSKRDALGWVRKMFKPDNGIEVAHRLDSVGTSS
jgi:spectinomycin phosphotransferase